MAYPTENYERPTRNMSEQDAIGGALADIAVALNRIADQWAVQNALKYAESDTLGAGLTTLKEFYEFLGKSRAMVDLMETGETMQEGRRKTEILSELTKED